MPDPNPYTIRISQLPNGERLPLLCLDGLPIYETTDWILSTLWPEGDATNTMSAKLRAVGHWFRWVEQKGICWEERVRTGKFLSQDEIADVQKWMCVPIGIPSGAKVGKLKVGVGSLAARMIFVGQYLRWVSDRVLHRVQDSTHDRLVKGYEQWVARWKKRTPEVAEFKEGGTRFGLSPAQQDLFLRVIHPNYDANPFEKGMRIRNHAILTLLLEHGLRLAEPLMLQTTDLKFGDREFVVPGRRNNPQDPRKIIPSPKKGRNLQQGGGRYLRLTSSSMRALETWMNEDRRDERRFPGARKSPYVFISERGRPLSVRRMHSIFETIRKAFPELGDSFSPHILRHTFVEEFIRNHPSFTPKERQDLCYLLGWSQNSKMPDRYGLPAIKESGGKRTQELSQRRHARALESAESEKS